MILQSIRALTSPMSMQSAYTSEHLQCIEYIEYIPAAAVPAGADASLSCLQSGAGGVEHGEADLPENHQRHAAEEVQGAAQATKQAATDAIKTAQVWVRQMITFRIYLA